jgi:hypothetical protein
MLLLLESVAGLQRISTTNLNNSLPKMMPPRGFQQKYLQRAAADIKRMPLIYDDFYK